jgi:hypothetical protein
MTATFTGLASRLVENPLQPLQVPAAEPLGDQCDRVETILNRIIYTEAEMNRTKQAALDLARGIELAKNCVHAIADGDDATVLALLNTASLGETRAAAAYLTSALREPALVVTKGDAVKASLLLHSWANATEDIAASQAMLVVHEALKKEGQI